jgi:hypothetical protein
VPYPQLCEIRPARLNQAYEILDFEKEETTLIFLRTYF